MSIRGQSVLADLSNPLELGGQYIDISHFLLIEGRYIHIYHHLFDIMFKCVLVIARVIRSELRVLSRRKLTF